MRCFWLLLFCLLSCFFVAPGWAMDSLTIAAKLQQRYDQTTTLQANFRQTTTVAGFAGREIVAQGTVILKKPGK